MKKTHRDDAGLRECCDSPQPDDGIPPQVLARRQERQHRRKPSHHLDQLCKQAARSIDASILCDCGDPVLDRLGSCRVTPKGRGNELLVTFAVDETDPGTLDRLCTALEAVNGLLRAAVAGAIHRKRVPGLHIEVIPSPA